MPYIMVGMMMCSIPYRGVHRRSLSLAPLLTMMFMTLSSLKKFRHRNNQADANAFNRIDSKLTVSLRRVLAVGISIMTFILVVVCAVL